MANSEYDAIVVGLGAAGSVVTGALSGAGWNVLALEEGPWYSPFRDFHDGRAERIPTGLTYERDSIRPSMVKCVGGSMLFYAGVFFRLHESDFTTRTRSGCGVDWPISYRELEPFYDKVEIFTGASGSSDNVFEVPRGPYPNPPHPVSRGSRYFADGARKLGYHPAPTPMSILSRPYRGRPACTYCAKCGEGCMIGDKSSPEMTYVPAAVNNGAEIRSGHKVLTIETNTAGRVTGVVYSDSEGIRQKAASDLVVLCGSALLNPTLLLRSRGPAHPEGLGARSGMVGRNLMCHTGGRYMARFPEEVNAYMGISGGINVQDFYEGTPDGDFDRGYTLYVSLLPSPPATFVSWYFEQNDWGGKLMDVMGSYNRMIRLAMVGEDQARVENMVYPDPDDTDDEGFPRPRVRYVRPGSEFSRYEHAMAVARKICRAGGADDWELYHISNGSAHPLGTCRMGDNPDTSVVNRWGACHDVPGLYICDGSAFPTSGAVNPALTIMALASRTADRLIARRTG
ncbi:MAG: GMC family oxidoreductase [Candidatus Glassbacteria bacterium]|nr:GMC family oxidoreductase [Candidatus Glassbacteria bacterium]